MARGYQVDGKHSAYRHGHCIGQRSAEHRAWVNMKSRCSNPNHRSFADYGARGITVCDRWKKSFLAFLEHVGPRPSPEHSIERIRNDGNYEPGNVKWAIAVDQQNNRRVTIFVNLKGERLPLAEACRRLGVRHNTIWMRIDRGMTPDEAISIPVGERFEPLIRG